MGGEIVPTPPTLTLICLYPVSSSTQCTSKSLDQCSVKYNRVLHLHIIRMEIGGYKHVQTSIP